MSLRRVLAAGAAALALGGGLAAGLGVGVASAGRRVSTATTATEPVVTLVTTPQAPGHPLPGTGKPLVRLADLASPEQFILGQLYQLALQHEGYTVLLLRNVGAPAIGTAGLLHGTLDLYPEYLGEWNNAIAHLHRRFRTLHAAFAAGSAYAHRHGFALLHPTPYSSTSCVAVLSQYAQANHIHSIPQLARSGGIIFGAPAEFQYLVDGLPALRHAYHLHPGYVQSIGVGLQYWWLDTGNVQAAYCQTTDPQLSESRYVELSDPKGVFGHGNVVPVTTPRVLRLEGPAFARTIDRVDALLTLRAMRGLVAEYSLANHGPTSIAYEFLEGNGILPPARWAPVPTTTTTTTTSSRRG